jgi:hypothetical protein
VFAEIAAVIGIGGVIGILKLLSLYYAHRKLKLFAQLDGFLQFAPRQTGRIGDGSKSFLSQNIMGYARQEDGINAARVGDQTGTIGAQQRPELLEFFHSQKMASAGDIVEPGFG